jgi:hypothetical protein
MKSLFIIATNREEADRKINEIVGGNNKWKLKDIEFYSVFGALTDERDFTHEINNYKYTYEIR